MSKQTDQEPRAALVAILDCTRRIQESIEAGDWSGAAQLDAERQRLLVACCASIEPSRCPPEVVAALAQLVSLNDALIGAVERRQRALQRDAEKIGVGRKAVAAYNAA